MSETSEKVNVLNDAEKDVIVRYRNVKKAFGDTVVLNDLNIDIKQGEKIALIGPSGSGKTTIIRMLMTLEQPTEGTIEVDGRCYGIKK